MHVSLLATTQPPLTPTCLSALLPGRCRGLPGPVGKIHGYIRCMGLIPLDLLHLRLPHIQPRVQRGAAPEHRRRLCAHACADSATRTRCAFFWDRAVQASEVRPPLPTTVPAALRTHCAVQPTGRLPVHPDTTSGTPAPGLTHSARPDLGSTCRCDQRVRPAAFLRSISTLQPAADWTAAAPAEAVSVKTAAAHALPVPRAHPTRKAAAATAAASPGPACAEDAVLQKLQVRASGCPWLDCAGVWDCPVRRRCLHQPAFTGQSCSVPACACLVSLSQNCREVLGQRR